MGKMQDNLIEILKSNNNKITTRTIPFPDFNSILNSNYNDEVIRIYKELGGVEDVFPCNLRKWDLEFDNIPIELDEYLHFNRYRKITLSSSIYNELSSFPLDRYIFLCNKYENNCLKAGSYGGKWTNNSCEKQFGKPSNKGDLNGNGSPRWKQRAFYDFIKDLTPLLFNIPLVRISIWDELELNSRKILIKDILDDCDYFASDAINNLIYQRKPQI